MGAVSNKSAQQLVPITAAMSARFLELAPTTLARRDRTGNLGHAAEVLQWLLLGGFGLYALFSFEAGPTAVLVLFLVGLYAGIICEGLVYVAARHAVQAQMGRLSEDRFVWAMADALSTGQSEIPDHAVHPPSAGCGLMLDVMLGVLCAIAWFLWFRHTGVDVFAILGDARMTVPLATIVLFALFGAVSSFAALRGGNDGGIKAGGRGLALFAMTFALMFSSESPTASFTVMLIMNLLALAIAALCIGGLVLVRRETRWLREHLEASRTGKT